MNKVSPHLDAINDIRQMMERSSRFISLSGLSGIAAGLCALTGAWFAYGVINKQHTTLQVFKERYNTGNDAITIRDFMGNTLLQIAILTFIAALILAFLFTYIRSRKNNTPIWSATVRRLMVAVTLPMVVGGIYLLKLIENGTYGLIAPGCLIFYGLALVNAAKFTLSEIKYLGYSEIALGVISLWFTGYGLYFWAGGFGVLHIIYGVVMWYNYERVSDAQVAR